MDWAELASTLNLKDLSLAGIVVFIVYRILTGGMYSGRAYDALGRERDNWKTAYFKSEEANRILMTQNSELIRGGRTTEHLVRSLPEVGGSS